MWRQSVRQYSRWQAREEKKSVRDLLLLSPLSETELSQREEDAGGDPKMVLSPRPIDESQYRLEGLSCGISHMALWARRIRGMDVNRFPPMGPWEAYVPLTLLSQPAPQGFPVCLAGSGKSIIWFVVHFDLPLLAGTHVDPAPQLSNTL
jgi:hypothetical protein